MHNPVSRTDASSTKRCRFCGAETKRLHAVIFPALGAFLACALCFRRPTAALRAIAEHGGMPPD